MNGEIRLCRKIMGRLARPGAPVFPPRLAGEGRKKRPGYQRSSQLRGGCKAAPWGLSRLGRRDVTTDQALLADPNAA